MVEKSKTGFFFVILAGALWGTTGTMTKYIYEYGLDPLTLALLRIGISFMALYLYAGLAGQAIRPRREDLAFFVLFGLVSVALFNVFYMSAIKLTTVATAVVLLYTAPAFSMIVARFLLKERLTRDKAVALFLTLAGVFLVVEAYRPGRLALNLPGVLAGLGAGFTYGVYSVFTKEALRRGYGNLETVTIALGAGLLFLLPLNTRDILPLVAAPFSLWLLVLSLAVFSTMLAYVFFVSGVAHLEAGRATLVAAVEPVVAIVLAVAFLGETLSWLQFLGVAAVLAAVTGGHE